MGVLSHHLRKHLKRRIDSTRRFSTAPKVDFHCPGSREPTRLRPENLVEKSCVKNPKKILSNGNSHIFPKNSPENKHGPPPKWKFRWVSFFRGDFQVKHVSVRGVYTYKSWNFPLTITMSLCQITGGWSLRVLLVSVYLFFLPGSFFASLATGLHLWEEIFRYMFLPFHTS